MIKERMEQRGQGGFTLIELLVVVAILAILVGVAVVGVGAMQRNARKSACKADKDTIETAAEAYRISENSSPANVNSLINGGYVKKVSAADWTLNTGGAEITATVAATNKYGNISPADCS